MSCPELEPGPGQRPESKNRNASHDSLPVKAHPISRDQSVCKNLVFESQNQVEVRYHRLRDRHDLARQNTTITDLLALVWDGLRQ